LIFSRLRSVLVPMFSTLKSPIVHFYFFTSSFPGESKRNLGKHGKKKEKAGIVSYTSGVPFCFFIKRNLAGRTERENPPKGGGGPVLVDPQLGISLPPNERKSLVFFYRSRRIVDDRGNCVSKRKRRRHKLRGKLTVGRSVGCFCYRASACFSFSFFPFSFFWAAVRCFGDDLMRWPDHFGEFESLNLFFSVFPLGSQQKKKRERVSGRVLGSRRATRCFF